MVFLGWQVGRVLQRYYRLGQEDVYGYDADDRLHSRHRSFEEHKRCHRLGNVDRQFGKPARESCISDRRGLSILNFQA